MKASVTKKKLRRETRESGLRSRYFSWFGLIAIFLAISSGCSKTAPQDTHAASWVNPTGAETIAWPGPPLKPRIKFVTAIESPDEIGFPKSWASRAMDWVVGRDQRRFVRPYGIAAREGEALVVTDPGSGSIHVFDFKNQKYRNITLEDDEGGLSSPVGVALDEKGNLYVADSERAAVFVFTLKGKLVRTIGAAGELARPAGVAYQDGDGLLYVVDVLGSRVVVFDGKGNRRFQFGSRGAGPGEFNYPTHIFVTDKGEVFVTDSMNFRVQAFDHDGTFLFAVGKAGDTAGNLTKPKGVAVDSDGHIYVVDALFDNVQILAQKGTPLLAFGSSGREAGQFWLPSGLWIDKQDRIYVADSFNQRIQIFQYVR